MEYSCQKCSHPLILVCIPCREARQKQLTEPKPKLVRTIDPNRKPGFGAMEPKQRHRIASLGGKSHSKEHMRKIGSLGGAMKAKNKKWSTIKSG